MRYATDAPVIPEADQMRGGSVVVSRRHTASQAGEPGFMCLAFWLALYVPHTKRKVVDDGGETYAEHWAADLSGVCLEPLPIARNYGTVVDSRLPRLGELYEAIKAAGTATSEFVTLADVIASLRVVRARTIREAHKIQQERGRLMLPVPTESKEQREQSAQAAAENARAIRELLAQGDLAGLERFCRAKGGK